MQSFALAQYAWPPEEFGADYDAYMEAECECGHNREHDMDGTPQAHDRFALAVADGVKR